MFSLVWIVVSLSNQITRWAIIDGNVSRSLIKSNHSLIPKSLTSLADMTMNIMIRTNIVWIVWAGIKSQRVLREKVIDIQTLGGRRRWFIRLDLDEAQWSIGYQTERVTVQPSHACFNYSAQQQCHGDWQIRNLWRMSGGLRPRQCLGCQIVFIKLKASVKC